MDIFKRPKFPPRPANYIPGVGRGAVPFYTRSDVGAADPNMNPTSNTRGHEHDREEVCESLFDKWMGSAPAPKSKKLESDDLEADSIYASIQDYMNGRNKRPSTTPFPQPSKHHVTPGSILSDLKPQLATITEDQWASLPESKSFVKKKKLKKTNFLPTSDSTIISAFNESTLQPSTNVKEKLISGSIARSNLTSFSSVDPEGYLTHLDTLDSNNQEIQDLKKLKTLLRSLLSTNPNRPQTWLAVSRIEEKDGNLKAAKELLNEAIRNCPDSEDLWIELARLEGEKSREILRNAVKNLPKAVRIWLAMAEKEEKEEKVKVLRKALEQNSESVKLWKELIGNCGEGEARKFLKNAVVCVPHSLDLWMALAKLEEYKGARKTLNEARKQLPCEPSIWIAAAGLEEAQGNVENVSELIKRGIKTLSNSGVAIDRKQWVAEAINSEKAGSILTAKAILNLTLHLSTTPENSKTLWLEDFDSMLLAGCTDCCRYFYQLVLDSDPLFKAMWKKAYEFEKPQKAPQKLKEFLQSACKHIPSSTKFWTSLFRILSLEELPHYTSQVLALSEISEKVHLELYKVLMRSAEYDQAQTFLIKSYENHKSCKLLRKLVSFYVNMNDLVKALEVQTQALHLFPSDPSIYKYISCIFPYDQARKILNNACQTYPTEGKLWIFLADLEKSIGNLVKCRFVLEQGRSMASVPDVFIKSIEFEKDSNAKAAELICNVALQKFKNCGKIWALAIELSNKKEKKSKVAEAFEHCNNDLELFLVVAKLFAAERKVEKARIWFEKCLKVGQENGDVWIEYYCMEKRFGDEDRVEGIMKRVEDALIRKGKLWRKSLKLVGLKSNLEVLIEASKILIFS